MEKVVKGRIDWNPKWRLTEAGRVAVLRLAELGVNVTTTETLVDMNICLEIPLWKDQEMAVYIEIGYLVAKVGDECFPDDFCEGISHPPSELFDENVEGDPITIDAGPGGLEVLISLREEREALRMLRTTPMTVDEIQRHFQEDTNQKNNPKDTGR